MKAIVTGSTGFVGQHLVRRLLREGHAVVGFDKVRATDPAALADANFEAVEIDLRSPDALEERCAAIEKIDFVFHTVAVQPAGVDMEIAEYLNTNLIAAMNLLKACESRGFRNIIASSSFSVYGRPDYLPIDEEHARRPTNPYGLSKFHAELLFEFHARERGFNVVGLRYDGIYGVAQTIPGLVQNLIGSFLQGKSVELFAHGARRRDQVYVGDAVEANLLAMNALRSGEYRVFNIGGGHPRTARETAEMIKEELQSNSKIVLSESKNPMMDFDTFMDLDEARSELGYQPRELMRNVVEIVEEIEGNAEAL